MIPTSTKNLGAWVIRAGKKGAAQELFLTHGIVALEDANFGDLMALPKERKAFYSAYARRHPNEGNIVISAIGGKFFRFIHEIKPSDIIIYPCIEDCRFYFGQPRGGYFFDSVKGSPFPHRRKVVWRSYLQKDQLPIEARRELGAARTFFKFDANLDDVLKLLRSKGKPFAK